MSNATMIGAAAPSGVWFKTHFYMKGDFLHAVTCMVVAGHPEVFRAAINLKPIVQAVTRAHDALHRKKGVAVSGFPGNIFKAAKAIGKAKIVRDISRGVKSVVKSKITGAIVATAATVFPPVGLPAAAAYAAANGALAIIDKANAAKQEIAKVVPGAAKYLNALDAPKSPTAVLALTTPAKDLGKIPIAVPVGTPPAVKALIANKPELKKLFAESAKAKGAIAAIAVKSKRGDPEAKAAARIFTITHHARKPTTPSAKAPKTVTKGGFPALLIDRRGVILPGQFIDRSATTKNGRAVAITKNEILRGAFDKVGGCVGCSNPQSLPAARR